MSPGIAGSRGAPKVRCVLYSTHWRRTDRRVSQASQRGGGMGRGIMAGMTRLGTRKGRPAASNSAISE